MSFFAIIGLALLIVIVLAAMTHLAHHVPELDDPAGLSDDEAAERAIVQRATSSIAAVAQKRIDNRIECLRIAAMSFHGTEADLDDILVRAGAMETWVKGAARKEGA